ncbi:EF-hand domain-containing protein [Winogradskyella schleiferi]|uniref:EF-hand domain-containing protein n=1 Tax=Winogradskyella schleiferi TaxID=2686078 RepID=UPI0015BADA4E|nr:EF-hand domain-containing protein [Winogradskyella schleiferi]
MITKTLKTGIVLVAIASFSFIGAQQKQEIKQQIKNDKIELKKDRSERMFKHLDINADNMITLEEFKEKRMKDPSKTEKIEKQFADIDTDKNETIGREEFKIYFESNLRPTRMEKIKAKNKKNAVEKG